jgi:hypothetical protein
MHPSGGAGGSEDKDFAPCGSAKAGGIGDSCAGEKKSKHWCGRGVTKEEEVLASQDQRLVKSELPHFQVPEHVNAFN